MTGFDSTRGCPRTLRGRLAVAGVACLGAVLAACGGSRTTTVDDGRVRMPPAREGRPCCVGERWAEPPPEIGQSPPDRDAPPDAMDAFVQPEPPVGTDGEAGEGAGAGDGEDDPS